MKRSLYVLAFFSSAMLLIAVGKFSLLPGQRALASHNDDTAIAGLEARVANLEARVQRLEMMLSEHALGNAPAMGVKKTVPAHGDWRSQDNWSRIKAGMSFDQVAQILGRPTRTDMTSADQGTWYYEGHLGVAGTTVSGNVFFAERRVLVVSPPVW